MDHGRYGAVDTAALRQKSAGINIRFHHPASLTVSGYGFFALIVGGVDVSPIAGQAPSWAWPLILIAATALFQFLRNLGDKRHQTELTNGPGVSQEK